MLCKEKILQKLETHVYVDRFLTVAKQMVYRNGPKDLKPVGFCHIKTGPSRLFEILKTR